MKLSENLYDLIVLGGGAAGFFCAIQCMERNPGMRILILEKSDKLLSKVKISGGGRCNVTHACFDPDDMTKHYPRGNKELLGPFHRFLCGDMIAWLSENGVNTTIEEDGRVFPESNNSQTVINCFLRLCEEKQINIQMNTCVTKLEATDGIWHLHTKTENYASLAVMLATGSSHAAWKMMEDMGHSIVSPVPSLFTFNIKDKRLEGLQGISVPLAKVSIMGSFFEETGPLLITHWGISGPAVLKLSAWAARELHDKDYHFDIAINWTGQELIVVRETIDRIRKENGKRSIENLPLFSLPKRLWQRMTELLALENKNYASLNTSEIEALISTLCKSKFAVMGKSTFKDEFVTCGGINTREINFKTMESKLHPSLFFAGEVINIDAITGGFNFQAAWTTAYIAAEAITAIDSMGRH